jgi:biopolymer transport protein TolR
MAGGMDLGQPSAGGKKPLDAPINLVPFIDLMAVIIAFLIMTAVWTQVGRLEVSSAGAPVAEQQPEPEDTSVPVTLLLSNRELKLSVGGTVADGLAFARDQGGRLVVAALRTRLDALREQLPRQQAITIEAEDDVRYEDLVRVIDTCIAAGLPGVRVSPVPG